MANKELLFKGVKYLAWTLPLLFTGPMVIHSSFKNQNHPFYWMVLSVGILICIGGIFLMYKGLKTFVSSLFDS